MTRSPEEKLWSRPEIENLIAEGKNIIIVDDNVLKVDAWMPFHPGGDLAMKHMVGRDATLEVTGLHSPETKEKMLKYRIGRIQGPWVSFTPPIQGGKFRFIDDECPSENDIIPDTFNDPHIASSGSTTPTSIASERDFIFDPRLRLRKPQAYASSISTFSDHEGDDPIAVIHSPKHDAERRAQEDLLLYPSLDLATQQNIIAKYRLLDQKLRALKLYECNYWNYVREFTRYSILFCLFVYFLRTEWFTLSAVFLGLFWHQITFTAHDAGHMGITHNYAADTFIGIFVAGFCGGLSLGWWKRSHNVHHIVTNEPDHDPDIQLMPFFAVDSKYFTNIYSTFYNRVIEYDAVAQVVLKLQHWLYYPILCFGRFNLYFLSWEHLLRGYGPRKGVAKWHRYAELVSMSLFWTWYGYAVLSVPTFWGKVAFFLISHIVPMPVHVQITLSHYAMSTSELGVAESFPQRMLRTTMDVDCPEWLDFVHGGLQFQAIHHLYPRMPRHNLRRAQIHVMEYCKDVGIPYALYGFYEGNKKVIGRLGEVAKQAAIFQECQRYCMENPNHH